MRISPSVCMAAGVAALRSLSVRNKSAHSSSSITTVSEALSHDCNVLIELACAGAGPCTPYPSLPARVQSKNNTFCARSGVSEGRQVNTGNHRQPHRLNNVLTNGEQAFEEKRTPFESNCS